MGITKFIMKNIIALNVNSINVNNNAGDANKYDKHQQQRYLNSIAGFTITGRMIRGKQQKATNS